MLNISIKDSERDLIDAIKEGKEEAISYLFREYGSKLMTICCRYSSDANAAQDLFQEGFLQILKVIGTFRFEAKFESWLYKIMVNHCLNSIRKRKKDIQWIELSESHLNQADKVIETEDVVLTVSQILELMNKLPYGYRIVLNMHAVDKMTHREIANELGISESTSKSQLFKARRSLLALIKMNGS